MANRSPTPYALLLLVLLLAGCERKPFEQPMPDQKLRREIFFQCMSALPKGPERTHNSNDWDEVVSECGKQAYYMSLQLDGQPK